MTSVSTDRRQGLNSSAAIKIAVRVASIANIAALSGLQTIDGVLLASGDRILVKDQTTASQNGIYDVDSGNWSRALDFDGPFDVAEGTMIEVLYGAINGSTLWRISTVLPSVGSAMAFVQNALSPTDSNNVQFLQSGAGAQARTTRSKMRDVVDLRDFMTAAEQASVAARNYAVDLNAALTAAITEINGRGGQTLELPPGGILLGGGLAFALANPIRIRGAGRGISGSGSTIIKHTANNLCLAFNSTGLWAPAALEGFEVIGNAGAAAKFASFSDASGHSVRNIGAAGYTLGSIFVLHNKIGWTEQFVAEDCMLRDSVAAFEFKRTNATGGTASFFGLVMRNVQCVPAPNGALVSATSTAGNELIIYGAEIDCRLWFDVGGAQGFFIGDYARFVQSHVNVMVDGLSVPTGADNLVFRSFSTVAGAATSGFIDVEGSVRVQQGANYASADALFALPSGPGIHIHRNLVHHTWLGFSGNPAFGPNCHVKGAKVTIGDVAKAADATYLVEHFQPMTSYRLHLRVTGVGYIEDATYLLSNYDVNTVSGVTLIAGSDTANAKCRTWNAAADHSFSAGNGLQFEILILAATAAVALTWQLDIEML